MARRTKIACICGALLTLLAIPGLVINFILQFRDIGSVLVFFPLGVNIVGMIVLILVLRFAKALDKGASETNLKKKAYVRSLTLMELGWNFNGVESTIRVV